MVLNVVCLISGVGVGNDFLLSVPRKRDDTQDISYMDLQEDNSSNRQ